MATIRLFTTLALLAVGAVSQDTNVSTPNTNVSVSVPDWKRCMELTGAKHRLDALPGNGWDNLENKDMGLAIEITYKECKTTSDGLFLIPDAMHAIPLQTSEISQYAEVFDEFDDYTSSTARSLEVGGTISLAHIGGKFSEDYQKNKARQVFEKTTTTRVEIRHEYYLVQVLPKATLAEGLKERLIAIAEYHLSNNTDAAMYETNLIIREYGTHVIRSVVAGGVLLMEDNVHTSYAKNFASSQSNLAGSASASFFKFLSVSFKGSYSASSSSVAQYEANRTQSNIRAYGGPALSANLNLTAWEDGLSGALVAVDRQGDPIHYLATSIKLPEIPPAGVLLVAEGLRTARSKYYQANTHQGCMNQQSPNFNYYVREPYPRPQY